MKNGGKERYSRILVEILVAMNFASIHVMDSRLYSSSPYPLHLDF